MNGAIETRSELDSGGVRVLDHLCGLFNRGRLFVFRLPLRFSFSAALLVTSALCRTRPKLFFLPYVAPFFFLFPFLFFFLFSLLSLYLFCFLFICSQHRVSGLDVPPRPPTHPCPYVCAAVFVRNSLVYVFSNESIFWVDSQVFCWDSSRMETRTENEASLLKRDHFSFCLIDANRRRSNVSLFLLFFFFSSRQHEKQRVHREGAYRLPDDLFLFGEKQHKLSRSCSHLTPTKLSNAHSHPLSPS